MLVKTQLMNASLKELKFLTFEFQEIHNFPCSQITQPPSQNLSTISAFAPLPIA